MTPRRRGRAPGAEAAAAPAVSVIVPARNAEATLGAALESVLAQDHGGAVEVIVAVGVRRVNADPLSFIGTVDAFEADLRRVAEILGLPAPGAVHRNSSGCGAGRPRRERYRAYFDGETRRLVEEMYGADLEFTGYRFDDARTAGIAPDRRAGGRPPPCRRSTGGAGRILARLWFRLSTLEVRLEERIRRSATARRILRPIRRLRAAPLRPAPGRARRAS